MCDGILEIDMSTVCCEFLLHEACPYFYYRTISIAYCSSYPPLFRSSDTMSRHVPEIYAKKSSQDIRDNKRKGSFMEETSKKHCSEYCDVSNQVNEFRLRRVHAVVSDLKKNDPTNASNYDGIFDVMTEELVLTNDRSGKLNIEPKNLKKPGHGAEDAPKDPESLPVGTSVPNLEEVVAAALCQIPKVAANPDNRAAPQEDEAPAPEVVEALSKECGAAPEADVIMLATENAANPDNRGAAPNEVEAPAPEVVEALSKECGAAPEAGASAATLGVLAGVAEGAV
jgi:hypothetical protein